MEAPLVVVVAGPNGAGKSTLAPSFLRDAAGIADYVNADTIARGLSAFSPERAAFAAGRIMLERLRALAAAGSSFAFETTLATRSYAPWLVELRRRGYRAALAFLWLRSPALALERVRERVRAGGHDVPEDVILRRFERGRRNFSHVYAPMVDLWFLLENTLAGGPILTAQGGAGLPQIEVDPAGWQAFQGGIDP